MSKCKVSGCGSEKHTSGMCQKHYKQFWRTGSPYPAERKSNEPTLRKHFMYGAWAGMVNRCFNENNSSYKTYGGVGITVCDRWRQGEAGKSGFQCFLDDMGERPDGFTLDRVEPTGPYSPENCRWASHTTQRNNLSAAGRKRGITLGSSAKRTLRYTPFGDNVYDYCISSGRSLNGLAADLGYKTSGYLHAVCVGKKAPSDRMLDLLKSDVLNFTALRLGSKNQ